MLRRFLSRFARDDSGATAVEYGLIAALIFLAILSSVVALGDKTGALYEHIKTEIITAMS
ncbi:MAG: Flp family type IVb pilin [Brevundimonas sp.]|nr:MAG: Flp family type IVb pilin [Brevundimonas sp.]